MNKECSPNRSVLRSIKLRPGCSALLHEMLLGSLEPDHLCSLSAWQVPAASHCCLELVPQLVAHAEGGAVELHRLHGVTVAAA